MPKEDLVWHPLSWRQGANEDCELSALELGGEWIWHQALRTFFSIWDAADRHSSLVGGVDYAAEMLCTWLTIAFICSITYLINLNFKNYFCHVFFAFHFGSSDFYIIGQLAFSALKNICQHKGHKWSLFQNHDILLMWHMFLLSKITSKPFSCQWDPEIKCLTFQTLQESCNTKVDGERQME